VLTRVFSSPISTEAELVRARLAGAGFHPVISGAPLSMLYPNMISEITTDVSVPESEVDAVRAYLHESKLFLDETKPHGELPEDAVCPVHEQKAVATCDRCGTFLCAKCGSLGSPPLCEDCVVRADVPRGRPRWVTLVARLWAFTWIGSIVLGLLFALLFWFRRH
jgi:hypothetical protein